MAQVLGGYSETKDADAEVQKICNQVRNKVEEKTKQIYIEFTASKYRKQWVSGINYLIKVSVGEGKYLHLKVWQKLDSDGGECCLTDVEENHTENDPLEP